MEGARHQRVAGCVARYVVPVASPSCTC
jgi:hypothetical protein